MTGTVPPASAPVGIAEVFPERGPAALLMRPDHVRADDGRGLVAGSDRLDRQPGRIRSRTLAFRVDCHCPLER